MRRLALVLVLVGANALAAQAHAQSAVAPGYTSASHVYRCTGGAKLPVVYLNIQGGDSFATIYVNGALTLMRAGPAGSGATYYPVDVQAGYRWQVKGDLGTLWHRAANPTSPETVVLQDCKTPRPP